MRSRHLLRSSDRWNLNSSHRDHWLILWVICGGLWQYKASGTSKTAITAKKANQKQCCICLFRSTICPVPPDLCLSQGQQAPLNPGCWDSVNGKHQRSEGRRRVLLGCLFLQFPLLQASDWHELRKMRDAKYEKHSGIGWYSERVFPFVLFIGDRFLFMLDSFLCKPILSFCAPGKTDVPFKRS